MKDFILQLNVFFSQSDFEWCVCGGYAIDLIAGHGTRPHEDLDISVFWQDKKKVINFMLSREWRVFEAMGGGVICELFMDSEYSANKRNLFCFTDGNSNCHLSSIGNDMYEFKLDGREHSRLDYIEFLFNAREDEYFIYANNMSIRRLMEHAIQNRDGIPFLAPELVLMYKSVYIQYLSMEDEYALRLVSNAVYDFNLLLPLMDKEKRKWLALALKTAYPNGHAWLRRLENS